MKHKVILVGCGIMAKQHSVRFEAVKDRVEISAGGIFTDIDTENGASNGGYTGGVSFYL